MSVGTAVIASNATSIPEVVGDAALLINPFDVDDIYRAMKALFKDHTKRQCLIKKGLIQFTKFSWETNAREVVGIYKEI
jgi:glycosyltransferase involved in cell wall biosynthesis